MKIILYEDIFIKNNNYIKNIFISINNYFNQQPSINFNFIELNNNYPKKIEKCDIAIIWGISQKVRPLTKYRNDIIKFQKINGNKIIILETGFIQRDKYYSISFNNFVGLGNYGNININDNSRLLKILPNYSKIIKKNGDNILICGQLPWDTVLQDINYFEWLKNIINKLRRYTKRNIIFRHHPLLYGNYKNTKEVIFNENKNKRFTKYKMLKNFIDLHLFLKNNNVILSENNDLYDDLQNIKCLIVYNSTTSVEALLNGIPFFTFSKHAVLYDISNNNITNENIENPYFPNNNIIKQFLIKISFYQWNLNEIEKGLPFNRLFNYK